MPAKKTGLGRGLNALINPPPSSGGRSSAPALAPATKPVTEPAPSVAPPPSDTPREVPVHLIVANPYQPRERFEEEGLEELTASIREMGILSPLLVRKRKEDGAGYQLVAGERRFRAAQRAGLKTVPVIVRDLSDLEALEIALVENLQRKDLNIIEEAEGYHRLSQDFALTQEKIAQRVGKSRASVANAMRLLALSSETRGKVADGSLSAGHAKALLSLEIQAEQDLLARQCYREHWSVRELERQVKRRQNTGGKVPSPKAKNDIPADHLQFLTNQLHQKLGTSVRLLPTRTLANGKKLRGRLEVDFYSNDDLDRLLDILGLGDSL